MRPLPFVGLLAAIVLAIAGHPLWIRLAVVCATLLVRSKDVVATLAHSLHIDERMIPLAAITSIERDADGILVVTAEGSIRITMQPELHDTFVRHALARIELARNHRQGKRLVLEAMLAHDAEAVVVRNRTAMIMSIVEARTTRNQRIFVRHELVGTYRTPRDPRFVLITPR